MKKILLMVLFICLMSSLCSASISKDDLEIAGLRCGMPEVAIENTWGKADKTDTEPFYKMKFYKYNIKPNGEPSTIITVDKGKIVGISTIQPDIKLCSGIHPGCTRADVIKAYGENFEKLSWTDAPFLVYYYNDGQGTILQLAFHSKTDEPDSVIDYFWIEDASPKKKT